MSGSLVLAVVATGAAGIRVGDTAQTGTAAFTVSPEAVAQANEMSDQAIADNARLVADRNAAVAQRSALDGKAQAAAKIEAERVAKQRREAAEKASRAAERKRLVDGARTDPKGAARAIMGDYGFGPAQWGCLERLWIGESNWNYKAQNRSSGAYGIPQSLPGSKMGSIASDWRTNPVTQIKWGLQYIKNSYGTPCNALSFWNSKSPHWY